VAAWHPFIRADLATLPAIGLLLFAATAVLVVLWIVAVDRKKQQAPRTVAKNLEQDNLEQVKLLFDYTKFHITVYTTLAGVLLTFSASDFAKQRAVPVGYVYGAIACIVVAGIAAGIVAASLPALTGQLDFWNVKTGPYKSSLLTLRSWTFVEHTFFWLAVFMIVLAFVLSQPTAESTDEYRLTISATAPAGRKH
jgi:large-conductance mechanosensitive channel